MNSVLWFNKAGRDKGCTSDFSYLFLQADCKLNDEDLKRNRNHGLVFGLFGCLNSLTFITFIIYKRNLVGLEYRTAHINDMSVKKFTVTLKMTEKLKKHLTAAAHSHHRNIEDSLRCMLERGEPRQTLRLTCCSLIIIIGFEILIIVVVVMAAVRGTIANAHG